MTAKQVLNGTIKVSKTTEFGLPFSKAYFKPTPRFWRKLGDGLLLASGLLTATGIAKNNATLAIIALVAGQLGKFITNCAKEVE
jgi:hypothetical protein